LADSIHDRLAALGVARGVGGGRVKSKDNVTGMSISFRPILDQCRTDIFSMVSGSAWEEENLLDGVVDFLAQAARVRGIAER